MKVKDLLELLKSEDPESDIDVIDNLGLFEIIDIKRQMGDVYIRVEQVESR